MTELRQALEQLEHTEDYGDAIPVTVADVYAYASYNQGWVNADFMYETPESVLVCESAFGELHVRTPHRNIVSGGFKRIIEAYDLYNISAERLRLRELLGKEVYLALNDTGPQATLYTDKYGDYRQDELAIIYEDVQQSLVNRDAERNHQAGFEPRSIDYLESQLAIDYERSQFGVRGWYETTLTYVGESDGMHIIEAEVPHIENPQWKFDKGLSGARSASTFVEELTGETTLTALEDALVYIKPIRDLHHTNRPSEHESLFLDSLERWAISADAMKPSVPTRTWWDRLCQFFSSDGGIEVTVGERTRRAKSSDEYSQSEMAVTAQESSLETSTA